MDGCRRRSVMLLHAFVRLRIYSAVLLPLVWLLPRILIWRRVLVRLLRLLPLARLTILVRLNRIVLPRLRWLLPILASGVARLRDGWMLLRLLRLLLRLLPPVLRYGMAGLGQSTKLTRLLLRLRELLLRSRMACLNRTRLLLPLLPLVLCYRMAGSGGVVIVVNWMRLRGRLLMVETSWLSVRAGLRALRILELVLVMSGICAGAGTVPPIRSLTALGISVVRNSIVEVMALVVSLRRKMAARSLMEIPALIMTVSTPVLTRCVG